MEKTQIANKLTVAELGLTKDVIQALLADKKDGEQVTIAVIFGKTTKYVAKPSKLDATRDDIAFVGTFEGHNLISGEVVNAPKAYLPGAAEMATRAAVDQLGEGEAVEFGCEIAVKKNSKLAIGYQFGVAVPKAPAAQDALASLRGAMLSERPALAAPADTAKKGK